MLTPHLFPLAVNGGSGGTDKRERGWGRFKKCNRGHGTGSGLLTTPERREGSRHLPCCVPTAPGAPSFSCHRSDLGGEGGPRGGTHSAPAGWAASSPPSLCASHWPLRFGLLQPCAPLTSPLRCGQGRPPPARARGWGARRWLRSHPRGNL